MGKCVHSRGLMAERNPDVNLFDDIDVLNGFPSSRNQEGRMQTAYPGKHSGATEDGLVWPEFCSAGTLRAACREVGLRVAMCA